MCQITEVSGSEGVLIDAVPPRCIEHVQSNNNRSD
jgi:hypothetical protein